MKYVLKDKEGIKNLSEIGLYEETEKIELPLILAALFAEKGLISEDWRELLSKAESYDSKAKDIFYLIKELYEKGYICRLSLDSWEYIRVYKKGIRPRTDRTTYILKFLPEKLDKEELKKDIKYASNLRKELIYVYKNNENGNWRFIRITRTNFQ